MSHNNEDPGRLSDRDRELVALGAAIASNCSPCVEYHIPQARKTGLSNFEIRQAVALADKVRQVPAEKVLQTASALLERQNAARTESENDACVCSESARHSGEATPTDSAEPKAHDVRLDNNRSEEDNDKKKECCGDDAEESTRTPASDDVAAGSRNVADHTGFDFSKMMEMMQKCCPDKMKDFSSMMSSPEKGCRFPGEKASSKEPV
jgi:AhpD family alkylhydroperoxidase